MGGGGERGRWAGATREREQEKYFFHGKFQYPGLCFACLVHARLRTIHQGERKKERKREREREREREQDGGRIDGTKGENRRPHDTLERFFSSVRDSSRHRGITCFCRSVGLSPANFILKPRIEGCSWSAAYDERGKGEKRRKERSKRILPVFMGEASERDHCLLRWLVSRHMIIGISVTLVEGRCALLSRAILVDSLFRVEPRCFALSRIINDGSRRNERIYRGKETAPLVEGSEERTKRRKTHAAR